MSLRRRDLFWQNSEKGGGPGDGDLIALSVETRTYGGNPTLDSKSIYIWPQGQSKIYSFNYNTTSGSSYEFPESFVVGNTLLSPDGKTVIIPYYGNRLIASPVETYGEPGVWNVIPKSYGEYWGDWNPDTISGISVLVSPYIDNGEVDEDGSGSVATTSITFAINQDLKMHVASDGEQNYDYLVVYVNGIEELNLSSSSAQGDVATALATHVLGLKAGSEVRLDYRKDFSASSYSDSAYVYFEKYADTGSSTETRSSASFVSDTWEIAGTLSSSTLFRSSIQSQSSATASAYFILSASNVPETVTLLARSNGESTYDYLKVYNLDSSSSVLKSFKGSASADTYTTLSFTLTDTQKHRIYFDYSKDGSINTGEDAAFVCLVGFNSSGSKNNCTMYSRVTVNAYTETYGARVGVRKIELYDGKPVLGREFCWFETGSYYTYCTGSARSVFPNGIDFIESGKLGAEGYINTNSFLGYYGALTLVDETSGTSITIGDRSDVGSALQFQTRIKYSDDGNIAAIIPLSSSTLAWTVQRLYQSASSFLKLLKAERDEDNNLSRYVETPLVDLLPVDSGSYNIPMDVAFSKTGKVSYILAVNVEDLGNAVHFTPNLYRSVDTANTYELLDWNPKTSNSSEQIVGVCTDFSGKVVYALTVANTGSSNGYWYTASLYRSTDRGNTFQLCSTHSLCSYGYIAGSTTYYNTGSALQRFVDIRYKPQIACCGRGDKVALYLISGSEISLNSLTGSLYRSEDYGSTWPYKVLVTNRHTGYGSYRSDIRDASTLKMNRN